MDVTQKIEKANFVAQDADVEALAALVQSGAAAKGVYLPVLVTRVQAVLGKPDSRRKKQLDQVEAVNHVHERLYAAVLRGVARGETIDKAEAQRRAGYARSAASELRGFASRGGDVRALDPAAVTKASLRPARTPASPIENVTHVTERLVRGIDRLIEDDADAGRLAIEAALAELESRLAALDQTEHVSTRTTVGRPEFRYPPNARAGRAQRVAA